MIKFSILLLTVILFSSCSQFKIELDAPKRPEKFFNVKWVKNLDPIHDAGNLPIGTASPLIYEDILYMGTLSGSMNAYDVESGRLLWSKNEDQPINAKATFYKDSVVYGTKMGRVFSRHYLTGKLNYAIDLGASVESAPVMYAGRMFLHLRNHRIVALDAISGKIIWSYKRSIPFTTTLQRVSRVLPYENKIIVGFADGYVGAISINEGVIIWEQKITNKHKFIDVDIDPILFNNQVVIGSANGDISFINPENGMVNRSLHFTAGHTPLKYKDSLYVGSVFGELAKINLDGSVALKKKIVNDGITSLTLWQGKLVASTLNGKLLSLNPEFFIVDHIHNLGSTFSTVFGSLEQSSDFMAVYSSRNRLYLFK